MYLIILLTLTDTIHVLLAAHHLVLPTRQLEQLQ